jgi:hypothetical protein
MMRSKRYTSNTAFLDLLFNVLLGFVVLFVIALLMINPITKKNDIPTKAEFMIIVEWPWDINADVDTWVRGPDDREAVGFRRRENHILHLDRDDLGNPNDSRLINGEVVLNKSNREVVTVRGIAPGDYFINLHLYNNYASKGPITVTVTLADVNPYIEHYVLTVVMDTKGQVEMMPAFTVNDEGEITHIFNSDVLTVPVGSNATLANQPDATRNTLIEPDMESSHD